MVKAPPLALLLMYVRFVAVSGMDRISTNGNCIFFDPSYLTKLKDDEMDFVFCHQIMHILCEDIWRPEAYAFSNYHYACDLKINSVLLIDGAFGYSLSNSGKVQHTIPGIDVAPKDMTIEEILSYMVFDLDSFDYGLRKKYLIDSDVYWGKAPSTFGSTLIIDREASEYLDTFSEDLISVDQSQKTDWRERAAIAFNSTLKKKGENADDKACDDEMGDIGSIAQLMQRIVNKLKAPTIDWRKILNDFLQEQICDYSFSPPDRRFSETGFFLPDFNEKDFVCKDVLFMVDTSGSVDDNAIASVYSEIKGALEQYNGKLVGKLGFFDYDSTVPVPMNSVGDLLSIVPVGGGGTDFYSIFSNLKNDLPACIIVFTDGKGCFPPEEIAQGIPVLWIIDNNKVTPPWGKTIRVQQKH